MKGMFENSATFTAYATIDAGYFMLSQYCEQLPEDAILDKQGAKQLIPIVTQIIAAKKVIEADATKDESFLAKLNACLTDKPPTDEQTPQAGKV